MKELGVSVSSSADVASITIESESCDGVSAVGNGPSGICMGNGIADGTAELPAGSETPSGDDVAATSGTASVGITVGTSTWLLDDAGSANSPNAGGVFEPMAIVGITVGIAGLLADTDESEVAMNTGVVVVPGVSVGSRNTPIFVGLARPT